MEKTTIEPKSASKTVAVTISRWRMERFFILGVCPSNRSAKLLVAKLSRISRHGEDLP
jgi:hypothetical protein